MQNRPLKAAALICVLTSSCTSMSTTQSEPSQVAPLVFNADSYGYGKTINAGGSAYNDFLTEHPSAADYVEMSLCAGTRIPQEVVQLRAPENYGVRDRERLAVFSYIYALFEMSSVSYRESWLSTFEQDRCISEPPGAFGFGMSEQLDINWCPEAPWC
ncbi:MAG: hypothetical protein AAFW81_06505 [Pseudomonadota bacterium]